MNFAEALKNENNWTKTENGMDAYQSSLSNLLDIFGDLLSFRKKTNSEITQKFNCAFNEDPLLAMKLLFYSRNIRGLGQGEKHFFRTVCHYLAQEHTEIMKKNLELIATFGRFDDYYSFVGTPLEDDAFEILKRYTLNDLKETNDSNLSLVGKWLKSINSNSNETRKLGRLTSEKFGLTLPQYRKMLSSLRKRIDVVERKLCSNDIENIKYENVPSKAMTIYNNSFRKKDPERFEDYLNKVSNGETKINAGAVYPYEILGKMNLEIGNKINLESNKALEEQWKALPNYITGEHNALVVADTSGSMYGLPILIALSLAVYLAERNNGIWKNKFITFSSKPKFIELFGDTLYQKLNGIESIVENTDIEKVFDLVLNAAVNNNLKQEEMVEKIIIVSDMQFDSAVVDKRTNYTEHLKEKFLEKGYKLPDLIYWNASGNTKTTYHALSKDKNVALVSGANPSLYKQILEGKIKTPFETMLETLNDEIFNCVTI